MFAAEISAKDIQVRR